MTDEMFGIRTDPSPLSIILEPLSWQLDACWWHLGGNGATLESADHDDYERLTDMSSGYQVGKPGWFRRFIDQANTDWAVYIACECSSEEMPRTSLDQIDSYLDAGVDWLGDVGKWPLPSDVLLVCRDVDDAWWDLFFRDEPLTKVIYNHLQRFPDIDCRAFAYPEER